VPDPQTATAAPLWQWSACDLAAAIASGEVTCLEAVGSVVDRVRETNGAVNAIVDDLGDDALRQAEEHDRALRRSGPIGPLHGVPVTVKENVDQKGRPTPNGVAAFADVIAPDDSPVVRNLLDAGAIVVGRTNTPEFSFRATTVNELHGRTFNPWNDRASAGGSSGGAGAATMMGFGPLAHGNDIGGSLRFPAYCCGAATVKPGLGRTPAYNPSATAERGMLSQVMSVQGLIAREVRDVRLGMRSLIRYDPRDPWQVPIPFDGPPEPRPKVAFTKNTFEFTLHPAVSTALDTARSALTAAGYDVEEVEPPLLRETAEHAARCLFGEAKLMLGPDIAKHGSAALNAVFAEYYRQFPPFEGEDLLRAMAHRNHYIRAWTVFLAEYPLVLTPFLPAPPFDWDRDEQGAEGVREVLGAAVYSYSMNLMGLPAACVPAGFHDGLPIGVQVVGRRFREDQILDAAEAVEQRAGVMAHRLWASRT
jgi:amidase